MDSHPYRKSWMSDDQWECYQMLADVFGGFHHVHGGLHPWGGGIALNSYQAASKLATFDFDYLTTAVILAHDRMIRFSVESSGPRMVKLVLHKRHTREGQMSERHPTIEDAVSRVRQVYGGTGE